MQHVANSHAICRYFLYYYSGYRDLYGVTVMGLEYSTYDGLIDT
jgi:hypothetical protein